MAIEARFSGFDATGVFRIPPDCVRDQPARSMSYNRGAALPGAAGQPRRAWA
jgi:hypothetical protein